MWQIAVALVAGCYAPAADVGAPCPDGSCPSGQTCDVDHVGGPTCVLPGTGGGGGDVDSSGETFFDAGLDDASVDLNEALLEALENPKAWRRWRDGKKAFVSRG